MTKAEDWGDTLDELTRRRRHAHAMGGTDRLAKHHGKGKLDATASSTSSTRAHSASSARSLAVRSLPTGSSPAPASSTVHR